MPADNHFFPTESSLHCIIEHFLDEVVKLSEDILLDNISAFCNCLYMGYARFGEAAHRLDDSLKGASLSERFRQQLYNGVQDLSDEKLQKLQSLLYPGSFIEGFIMNKMDDIYDRYNMERTAIIQEAFTHLQGTITSISLVPFIGNHHGNT